MNITCRISIESGQCDGVNDCKYCRYGNPCLGCDDYDVENDSCKSYGGCGRNGEIN